MISVCVNWNLSPVIVSLVLPLLLGDISPCHLSSFNCCFHCCLVISVRVICHLFTAASTVAWWYHSVSSVIFSLLLPLLLGDISPCRLLSFHCRFYYWLVISVRVICRRFTAASTVAWWYQSVSSFICHRFTAAFTVAWWYQSVLSVIYHLSSFHCSFHCCLVISVRVICHRFTAASTVAWWYQSVSSFIAHSFTAASTVAWWYHSVSPVTCHRFTAASTSQSYLNLLPPVPYFSVGHKIIIIRRLIAPMCLTFVKVL